MVEYIFAPGACRIVKERATVKKTRNIRAKIQTSGLDLGQINLIGQRNKEV